ncbi:MAG: hypothetical protein HOP16_21345 [Acidobacteria bacterium]|nr:hypothetical protein [Acidobacteriota bacterium]
MTVRPLVPFVPEGFQYFPHFLSEEEVQEWLSWVEPLPFRQHKYRGRPMNRRQVMFGFEFVAGNQELGHAGSFPEKLVSLGHRIAGLTSAETEFNQCIVTKYPAGAGIGWHTDAPCFLGGVAALSLGADGRLQLRPEGEDVASHELVVAAGSLYVMNGVSRWSFQHRLMAVRATRYSLSFRHARVK